MRMLSKHLPSTRTLQCYLAVAQELNFRRAAELLHMSQPPLSRQIQGLEALLGVRLLERDTRRVTLTAAGEAFKDEAYRLLHGLDLAVGGLKERFAGDAGAAPVRIGLTSVINHALVPALEALVGDPAFSDGHPLERAWSKHLVERVRNGALDLAIVGDIVAPGADLAVEKLGAEPLLLALPVAHPAACQDVVDLAALDDMPLFWCSRSDNPAFYDKCEHAFKRLGYTAPRRPEPRDFTLLLAAVAAGEGVALCPQSMRATSRIGVVYRHLPPGLGSLLAIEMHIVSRAHEVRRAVLDKVQAIRAVVRASGPGAGYAPMPAIPAGL